jgi:hypothetical protein
MQSKAIQGREKVHRASNQREIIHRAEMRVTKQNQDVCKGKKHWYAAKRQSQDLPTT